MIHMRKKCITACALALILMLLASAAFAAMPEKGEVTASKLMLRAEPNSSSAILCEMRKGSDVKILGKSGGWYKVSFGKYTGYAYATYIDAEEIYTKGDSGAAVKKLQQRLKDLKYFDTNCTGYYGDVTVEAVKAFQKRNSLSQTGIANEKTLDKLYSDAAKAASNTAADKTEEQDEKVVTLQKGDSGSAVRKLQQRLRELDYFDANCTGYYGDITVEAVKAFQKRNGLTQNGVANEKTQDKLYSSSAKAAEKKEEDKDDDKIETDGILRRGDSGADVKKVQQRLKELGYLKASATSYFGSQTEAAVKAFQKRNSLSQTGTVNAATKKKLESAYAKEAEDKDVTLQKGDSGSAVKKLQERLEKLGYYHDDCDGDYGTLTVNAVKAFQKNNGLSQNGIANAATQNKLYSSSAKEAEDDGSLKKGDSGADVKKIQERLKELGYFDASCTGNFGSQTVEAVKAFQKRNNLTQDGVVNEKTLKKLNSSSALKADTTLREGSSGTAVKELQDRLKELGFFTSTSTGNFGEKTTAALKAFQKKNGLSQTGVVNASTEKKLESESAVNVNGQACVILKTSQTLKKGDEGRQVRALQVQLKKLGYYTKTLNGEYDYNTAEAVSAFQRGNKLTVNGTANATTLRKIMSSKAVTKAEADKADIDTKTYVTEKLDWFKKGQSTFPKKAIIQVKDVRTGLIFKAKVMYGTNHLDVEPLTKADTAILLKINGGVEFSWRRRPMLVKYNGHVYAASIYSEPHGDQTILDNNFDGQFCLHFYGSKTHGTDEVKQDHQDCVAQAMKATW